jgi:pimeloyl-ACP methyl ester carboxylesterase
MATAIQKQAIGPYREVRFAQGTIRYREIGAGEPIVFVHGLLTNGTLWRNVAPTLAARGYRCILPDWPLGAHSLPMDPDADLTFSSLARLVDEFLTALDLRDVTLVGNDTGGALSQVVVTTYPERVGRLVLTNCDAFANFLPLLLRYFQWGAHVPGFVWLASKLLPIRPLQRLPFTLGWLTKDPIPAAVLDGYFAPMRRDAAIRRDLEKVLRAISPQVTLAAADRLPGFARPVLIAWAPEDRLFTWSFAERLAARFPDARLVPVPNSYGFIPEDQPLVLAGLIDEFLRESSILAA